MDKLVLDLPTRRWVPQWLGIVTVFIILLPVLLMNGAYTGSTVDVSNTLGVLSEDMTMAYYSTSAGLAMAYPVIRKIRDAATSKTVLLFNLVMQTLLSFACGYAKNMDVIIMCSFFIGFLKAFVMFEVVVMIQPFFSRKKVRSEFYAWFYPLAFAGGQVSIALTAQLAYYYQWQHMYYLIVIMLLVAIIFVLCFFTYLRRPIYMHFKRADWKSIPLAAGVMLMTIYLFTYGRTLEWFASGRLRIYAVLIPLLFLLFIQRQRDNHERFASLRIFGTFKPAIGYVFMFFTMLFSTTSTLVTNYMNSVLGVDSLHSNALALWLLPGFALGGFICFWWFRWQRWRFRYLISGGLWCFVVYLALLYFGVSTNATYEALYLPTFFRGLGMMVLFIALALFVVEDLKPDIISSNTFFMISIRSSLAPAISASLFSNWLYHRQTEGMHVLAEGMRMDNPLFAGQFSQSFTNALTSGHSLETAAQLADNSFYATLQQQATLLGIKAILGYMLMLAIALAVVAAFIPFHKTIRVPVVKTGDDMA